MASQKVTLKGMVKWAKVYPGQEDKKYDADGKFSICLYPDEASLIKLKNSGSRTKMKEDQDGVFYQLSKDAVSEIDPGPPIVGMGKNPDGTLVSFKEPIGNGSVAEVKISVYDSKFGKGTRLEAINILEHKEFVKEPVTAANYKF